MTSSTSKQSPSEKTPLSASDIVVVLVTTPDETVAVEIANHLLSQKRIACANLIPKVRSLYWWEGAIQDEAEVLLILKTQSNHVANLISEIKAKHPYSVPEVIVLPVIEGSIDYLDWVKASTTV